MRGPIFLTGATGFVGMELLARYLERTDRRVFALIRAGDELEARARLRATLARIGVDDPAGRVMAVRGDVERPRLGLDSRTWRALAAETTEIVHAAASVSFTLGLSESRAINVTGTRRMLQFAEACELDGGLERFSYVSTAYVAGRHRGTFGEDDLDVGQGFRNAYERSKFEAEELVRRPRRQHGRGAALAERPRVRSPRAPDHSARRLPPHRAPGAAGARRRAAAGDAALQRGVLPLLRDAPALRHHAGR